MSFGVTTLDRIGKLSSNVWAQGGLSRIQCVMRMLRTRIGGGLEKLSSALAFDGRSVVFPSSTDIKDRFVRVL